ncbi:MAG: NAD-dependent epimerase/dehydratase family protein [Candidatus Omnitrophota bacterium]
MKILVTGGMGFVGSHLVDALVKEGHDVVSFDNLERQVHEGRKPNYLNNGCRYIMGDMRNKAQLKAAISGIDIIFHEAAMVGVGQSMYKVSKYIWVNSLGTANLLDILVNDKHGVRKLIVASSMSIYGEGAYKCRYCGIVYPQLRPEAQLKNKEWEVCCPKCKGPVKHIPTAEDKPLFPTSVYAYSKKEQEDLCLLIGRTYGMPTVALRYFNIYGPRQALSNPYTGVCAILSARIKNNHSPLIYEDGLQSRDFIHVRDIVRANLFVMRNSKADFCALNVGTGRPTTILDIARILIKLYEAGALKPDILSSCRKGDIRHCYADTSAIRSLGFKANIGIEEGMQDLKGWAREVQAKDKVALADRQLLKRGLRAA